MKFPNFTFEGGRNQITTNFSFSFKIWQATTLGVRQSCRLREVVAYGKDQQNKRNTGLIN